jgi:hypothetical protein
MPDKDAHQHAVSAQELSEKWADQEVHIPKVPFFLISLYQFCIPIFPLLAINILINFIYQLTSISILGQVSLAPLVFILNYIGYIWFMTLFCKLLNHYYEKKSPSGEGVFSRDFSEHGVEDPRIHYYHLRGFLYKWPVFVAKKSIFPWTVNFVLREIAENEVHKDALMGDVYSGLEYTDLDEGVVIMDGSSLSSHVVDSIFGALSILRIKIKKNSVIHGNVIVGPGAHVEENLAIAPKCLLPKRWATRLKDAKMVWGQPVPMKSHRKESFLKFLPENFANQWNLKKSLLKIE